MENLKTVDLFEGHSLLQSRDYFPLTQDSVLLSDFASLAPREKGMDLGCGVGCIGLLMLLKNCGQMDGVELHPGACHIAEENYRRNSVNDRGRIICEDLRNMPKNLYKKYDVCVSNPPYFTGGLLSQSPEIADARNSASACMADVVQAAAQLLKTGGRLYICQKPDSTESLMSVMAHCGFSVKQLRFVHQSESSPANLLLAEARLHAREGCTVLPPLLIADKSGDPSEEYKRIYRRT